MRHSSFLLLTVLLTFAATAQAQTDEMANKYITDGTIVSYEIKNKRCNLKLATEIVGSKNYSAVIILQLQY